MIRGVVLVKRWGLFIWNLNNLGKLLTTPLIVLRISHDLCQLEDISASEGAIGRQGRC